MATGRCVALAAWAASCCAPLAAQAPRSPEPALSGALSPVHDPAVIAHGAEYYVFSTGQADDDTGLIPWRVSEDLERWRLGGAVFERIPRWARERVPGTRGLWAPDIVYANGEYRLYYSVSTFGRNDSAIGLAVTTSLDADDTTGGWVDKGLVVASSPGDDFNAIDPSVLVDRDGRHWMAFGSFWSGIKLIALDPETGLRSERDTKLRSLARRPSPGAVEAPFLVERDGFYYLFVSFDFCCRGVDSTYYTVVGRSRKPTGPYRDRQGRRMMRGGGTIVLHAAQDPEGRYVGPGHVAVLEDAGDAYIVYHAYDTEADGAPTLRIRRLVWTPDGWPAPM